MPESDRNPNNKDPIGFFYQLFGGFSRSKVESYTGKTRKLAPLTKGISQTMQKALAGLLTPILGLLDRLPRRGPRNRR